mmetsp:Transcript_23967/g.52449  ORF Transcript_23967/g.52449 Transcript_23967/m.52449 type:complete len:85 (-) Transcript_23967:156-410(-)
MQYETKAPNCIHLSRPSYWDTVSGEFSFDNGARFLARIVPLEDRFENCKQPSENFVVDAAAIQQRWIVSRSEERCETRVVIPPK